MSLPDHKNDPYFREFINIPLIRASRKMQNAFYRAALAPRGLSIQEWRTLLVCTRLKDDHLRAIARWGVLDATHVSRATASLETKGLVRRYADPKDVRRKRIAITQAGEALVAEIWPEAQSLDAHIRASLGEAEYAALRTALMQILDTELLAPAAREGSLAAE
ncbi:hypothetical protein AIOL_002884 [Candidatus Rhodobacter oscarellae]|uniref:HTH marR-type domain-containing protein n=1 Tax=Candidatus Rhodobacter oscarellae TaxID=1675527 RepID=A0A0J9E5E7_9RHOB|nr:MarR family winged helix-turn-helix transcriptional regulator [Candidatus Rhodobacter lobularis]KMW57916.1 hypothetical protein AIOL_002884 [Candidatus Rhodobacter lobularis]